MTLFYLSHHIKCQEKTVMCVKDTHYKIEYYVKLYLASACHMICSSAFVMLFKATEEKHFS